MSGAAVLCGTGCLRGGAGLVQVGVPGEILPVVAAGNPCLLTTPFAQDLRGRFAAAAIDEIIELTSWADVVAVGPGIGQSDAMPGLLAALLERVDKPMVIDADGLNALAKLAPDSWRTRRSALVLTPHPGEFVRLTGRSSEEVQSSRQELAVNYASEQGVVLVLKGHATLVTDGKRLYRNTSGNPGMATAGTGDILTGLIAALLGQRFDPFRASVLATWAHGRAGDLAAGRIGQTSLIATDVLDSLPAALREAGG
jgi:NAD(P)H-hydrate epimerase